MTLSDFKAKHVPGLYTFCHFEAANGAYIQAHVSGGFWMYQDADGKRQEVYSLTALRTAIEATR